MGVRFAPSPTGRFHIGNLRTAWISWRWARALGLPWVVRFEDIDRPRVLRGAQESQLGDLRALGLEPDQVVVQSSLHRRHYELFSRAVAEGAVYPCVCSRKEVQDALSAHASAPHQAVVVYNGRCREVGRRETGRSEASRRLTGVAWRLRGEAPDGSEDFIIARTERDRLDERAFAPAYHWACAIDDRDGSYSLLVRAWDLESAVPLQRAIHRLIDRWEGERATPAVFHSALVTREDGGRLEKRTRGVILPELEAVGISPSELSQRFAASFADWDDNRMRTEQGPERVFGESMRTIPLSSFGL